MTTGRSGSNPTAAPAPTPSEPPAAGVLAADRLGVVAIAFFVVAAAAPMAAVVGASGVLFSAVGPATPLVYVLAALMIALFAVGYLRMSRHITNAGGFVAYIAKGLGNRWASGGAGLAVLTYLTLQVGLWSQFGVFTQSLVADLTGLSLPPLVWILVVLALVTLLTVRGVDASVRLLGLLIVGETAVVAVLVVALVARHGWGVFSIGGFTAENLFSPGLGVALLFAFLCFTAFEATVVFSEEARDPRRTIPRALYLVIAFVGAFYGLSTWVIGGAIGIDAVSATATADPAGFIFTLAEGAGGRGLSLAMQILVVTSFVAMLLGLCNMFSRYLFALGRAGALPRRLSGTTSTGSPHVAALVNSGAVAAVITAFLLAGADPIGVVFAWFTALGTAAFISVLILTSLAIVVFFARRTPDDVWGEIAAPSLSILLLAYVGHLTLSNYTLLSGSDGVAGWMLLAVPVFLVAGVVRHATASSIDYAAEIF
ncbi:APC family permease [Pseudonocardia broussonetiae]|uniref:APC family permease n=1 Tax=Pseudonocardia broussonetiae TaxID=2736640 RepID=A0A6M6JRN6_9PSEU|nr:APC family permease [Pseudonocardia broussonetiae]QJY49985.1 APC family permease [Pseudonocardia broussonetiae]